jgi:hypothetical protein
MTTQEIDWPIKGRELHTQLFDSTIWNDFIFREDDIVISTWSKSGTAWVRQIVAQLLFDGAEELEVAEMSLWLDLRVPPKEVSLQRLERKPIGASSRRTSRWTRWFTRPRPRWARWARWARCDVELAQPLGQRKCGAQYGDQRYARAGRAAKSVPLGGTFWDGGARTFIHKGVNGRWCDELTKADCHAYEETARHEPGEECARWLANGQSSK